VREWSHESTRQIANRLSSTEQARSVAVTQRVVFCVDQLGLLLLLIYIIYVADRDATFRILQYWVVLWLGGTPRRKQRQGTFNHYLVWVLVSTARWIQQHAAKHVHQIHNGLYDDWSWLQRRVHIGSTRFNYNVPFHSWWCYCQSSSGSMVGEKVIYADWDQDF